MLSQYFYLQNDWLQHSYGAVIHVYDELGNVIETHQHAAGFKER